MQILHMRMDQTQSKKQTTDLSTVIVVDVWLIQQGEELRLVSVYQKTVYKLE